MKLWHFFPVTIKHSDTYIPLLRLTLKPFESLEHLLFTPFTALLFLFRLSFKALRSLVCLSFAILKNREKPTASRNYQCHNC